MKNQITAFVFLFSLLLFSPLLKAQLIFTSADDTVLYTTGKSITNYSDTSVSSIEIGAPGGGNNWDFSMLHSYYGITYTTVQPSSTPYFSDYPATNLVTHYIISDTVNNLEGWEYYNSDSNTLSLSGIVNKSVSDNATYLSKVKNNPPEIALVFPFTINSHWSRNTNYTEDYYTDGNLSHTTSITRFDSAIVDAYGSITVPGGKVLQALRIKRIGKSYRSDGSYITSISYTYMTTGGYSVTIVPSDTLASNSGIVNTNDVSWSYADLSGSFSVTKPSVSEVVLAGSSYNISWNSSGINSLRIDFSADSGKTYKTIADNVPAGEKEYSWKVKDTLDTKCLIRIVDDADTTQKALSGLFHIKGYVLTRIDDNGNYEKFDPTKHGWKYLNADDPMWPQTWWSGFDYIKGIDPYTNKPYPVWFSDAGSSRFPDWPLFVQAFTPAQCYVGTEGVYRGKALIKWAVTSDPKFDGSCFGFAVSSFLAFEYKAQFLSANPGMPDFTNLYDLSITDNIRKIINENYILQFGKQTLDARNLIAKNEPIKTLQQLKDMLLSDNPNIQTVAIFYFGKGGGGHELAPYKLVQVDPLNYNYNLFVYDSNHPGDTTRSIYIDSLFNTWTYNMGSNYWNGTDHFYLDLPVLNYLSTPVLNKKNDLKLQKNNSVNYVELYNTPDANVMYASSNGNHIGLTDSVVTNEITNAMPIIKLSGYPSNPIGYYVPDDSYTAILNNAADSSGKVYLAAFKNDVVYDYERDSANATQTDRFKIDSSFSVVSPDPGKKHITNLEVISESDTLERIMFMENTQLSQNDSLCVQEDNQKKFKIKNYGSEKTYDLELDNRSTTGQMVFQYFSIDLKANSTHILVPDWSNLNTSTLKIYVDIGNHGKISDSLSLVNQVTGLNNNSQLSTPVGYNLAQNYPNPFNPTTIINYSVPKAGLVTIKVYDILGREVALLVNEVKVPGNYSVELNASKLSSGVYFYRLQAGAFAETKKMILIK